jgi:hypothetical protein
MMGTRTFVRMLAGAALAALVVPLGAVAAPAGGPAGPSPAADGTPIQVYGAWHCGNDFCTWGTVRDMAAFDVANRWLVDRDGAGPSPAPSVNLVVLSFVNPLKLLNGTNDATTANGIPKGMTKEVVNYFTAKGIRVMLSIGGITYTDAWNQALAQGAAQLGQKAAAVAGDLGVGIEIDYEQNASPNLTGLQAFITAYRSVHPYDATALKPAARLTIDLAAGDRWLIALTRKATADWLSTDTAVLDYANAMVPARQPRSASEATANWQEHIDGKAQYAPPIPPLAPARFTAGLYVALGGKVLPECNNYARSLQSATRSWVQSAASKVPDTTPGLLGYMFWAAERPSTRGIGTVSPDYGCEGGMGAAATDMSLPIPMPALRQR